MSTAVCWPRDVASLACERATSPRLTGRATWLLEVCGPFCLFPRQVEPGHTSNRLSNQVSAYLALPVRCWLTSEEPAGISLRVIVSDSEQQRLLRNVYAEEILRRNISC